MGESGGPTHLMPLSAVLTVARTTARNPGSCRGYMRPNRNRRCRWPDCSASLPWAFHQTFVRTARASEAMRGSPSWIPPQCGSAGCGAGSSRSSSRSRPCTAGCWACGGARCCRRRGRGWAARWGTACREPGIAGTRGSRPRIVLPSSAGIRACGRAIPPRKTGQE